MTSSYTLFQIAKKGYLQRIRSYRFLIIVAITVIFVYLFIPGPDATYRTFSIGDFKGIYNSSYIAVMTAIGTSLLVSLFAFFTINNALELDNQKHMGEIIASTPVKNRLYLFGQSLSNFVVLLTILGTIIFTSLIIFFFRQQISGIEFLEYFLPFVLICIPIMFVISVVAVVFETFFLSRYITMIILYYICYMTFLGLTMTYLTTPSTENNFLFTLIDPFGIIYVIRVIQNIVLSQYSTANVYDLSIGFSYSVKGFPQQQLFLFNGIDWQIIYVFSRLVWIIIPVFLVLVIAKYFKRFDPSNKSIQKSNTINTKEDKLNEFLYVKENNNLTTKVLNLSSLQSKRRNINFFDIFENEVRSQLKGQPKWWIVLFSFFVLFGFTITSNSLQMWSISWICVIPVISSLGSKEKLYDTYQMVYSSPHQTKQFYYQLASYFSILFILNLGVIIDFIFQNEFMHILAVLSGMLFIIALASFLGEFTGSRKLFESFFLLLLYLGPLNGIAYFDFIGMTNLSLKLNMWIVFLSLAILLLISSYVKRKRVEN